MFNKVILIGNLVKNMEIMDFDGGSVLGINTIAINKKITKNGENTTQTTFIDFKIWGKGAQILKQYTQKGDKILIEGELMQEQWQDKQDNTTRSKIVVKVDTFSFLNTNKSSENAEQKTTNMQKKSDKYFADENNEIPF